MWSMLPKYWILSLILAEKKSAKRTHADSTQGKRYVVMKRENICVGYLVTGSGIMKFLLVPSPSPSTHYKLSL